jgi:hypothetical protein
MRMIFGAIGGMKFGRGNRSTRRQPTPGPLCPPQNPTWQTRSRTPDRSGGKSATNRLSYGAAFFSPISSPLTTRRVTVEVFDPASTPVISTNNETFYFAAHFNSGLVRNCCDSNMTFREFVGRISKCIICVIDADKGHRIWNIILCFL